MAAIASIAPVAAACHEKGPRRWDLGGQGDQMDGKEGKGKEIYLFQGEGGELRTGENREREREGSFSINNAW